MGLLPESAVRLLPETLDDSVRAELMKRTPEEAAEVVMKAIEQVNHGSIESVEALVGD